MLSVDKVSISLGGSRILRDVSLEVGANHVFCLMGRNGVGKTTTLKSVVGLYKPNSGRVVFDGHDISRMPPEGRARAGIGYVPQGRGIFPHLTVEENLSIGAVAKRKKSKEALERVYSLFPIIKDFLARKGGMLSGGQQQQLAIGRALLTEPKLLILDEPTEGIQPNIIDQIGEAIKLLRKESITILLVEQYLEFCKELADNFAILDRGSVVAQGPVADLTDQVVKQHLTV
ncbi:MAG: urea ABC transporter ATP-binding subunit UrtE [Verrucomicrobia bacterium]|nr:urea ABC transporter ATP-binding subunit UrtE [Verrucomicrobiota bacterium]